jgi:phage-related protein
MVQWRIVTAAGSVGREIRGLSPGHQADFLRICELLCRYGPQEVGMPHVRPLGDKPWEIRLRDAGGIARAICFTTSGRRIVVLMPLRSGRKEHPGGPLIWRSGGCRSF